MEELRRGAGGDNARDRALDEMMDGVLEVKNEDILKQDILRPEFMDDPELRYNLIYYRGNIAGDIGTFGTLFRHDVIIWTVYQLYKEFYIRFK